MPAFHKASALLALLQQAEFSVEPTLPTEDACTWCMQQPMMACHATINAIKLTTVPRIMRISATKGRLLIIRLRDSISIANPLLPSCVRWTNRFADRIKLLQTNRQLMTVTSMIVMMVAVIMVMASMVVVAVIMVMAIVLASSAHGLDIGDIAANCKAKASRQAKGGQFAPC